MKINILVIQKVPDAFPSTVEYSCTKHSYTLGKHIGEQHVWDYLNRKKIIEG